MAVSLEQRRFARVPVGFRVKVMADYVTIPAQGLNIGRGGLFLETRTRLPLGQPCHIIIFVEEEASVDKILAWGVVARVVEDGLAIRFTELLGEHGMERLHAFLVKYAPDPGRLSEDFPESLANPA